MKNDQENLNGLKQELEQKQKLLSSMEENIREFMQNNNRETDLELSKLSRRADLKRGRTLNIGMSCKTIWEVSIRTLDGDIFWVPLSFEEMEIFVLQIETAMKLNGYQRIHKVD